jgi:hypothetical protein
MEYVVAIPSYNRPNEIIKKTLKTLADGGVDMERIFIFVANEEQAELYKPTGYKIIIGVIGIANQRVFISNYFPVGQYIISLDDDVEELQTLHESKLVRLTDLHTFFTSSYEILMRENLFIWGIYPVRNAFFMKSGVMTKTLKFLLGVCYGYINRNLKELYPTAEGKEDIEQSILYYKRDGGVIRFNHVAVKTKFNSVGGLGKDRYEMNEKASQLLKERYPDVVTIFKRKNGMCEVRLKEKKGRSPKGTP